MNVNQKLTKGILSFSLLLIFLSASAQSIHQKFYKDKNLYKEVEESKAKYVNTITENVDGSATFEVKEIKSSKLLKRYSYKGLEPVGYWVFENEKMNVDYDFTIEYIDSFICADCYKDTLIKDYFVDNDTFNFKAPILNTGYKSIWGFLANKVSFPAYARENNIDGKLVVSFIIDEKGKVNDVKIIKGAHIVLDKELVMVIRSLRFSSPCLLNNKPIKLGFTMPFIFSLE
jgi:TonB family protein